MERRPKRRPRRSLMLDIGPPRRKRWYVLHAPPVTSTFQRFMRLAVFCRPYGASPLAARLWLRWKHIERFRREIQGVWRIRAIVPHDLDCLRLASLWPRPAGEHAFRGGPHVVDLFVELRRQQHADRASVRGHEELTIAGKL